MSKEKSLGLLLLSIVELVGLVALTVSVVLGVDYLMIKWYFEPVLGWNFACALLGECVLEGIAFIIIGIRFLQEKVERSREGYIWDPQALFRLCVMVLSKFFTRLDLDWE